MHTTIKTGVILCGGEGTRLLPYTKFINKSLLGIDGKFVIDYPLQTLLRLGIEDLVVILGGPHFSDLVSYVRDGKELGFKSVAYCYQGQASGISQGISLCERLINDERFLVILGDNVFLDREIAFDETDRYGAQIVLCQTNELQRFGVASLDRQFHKIVKIEEKPKILENAYDQYGISGLYVFDQSFFTRFKKTKPSARGEYEITSILDSYMSDGELGYSITKEVWKDAGNLETINYLNNYLAGHK